MATAGESARQGVYTIGAWGAILTALGVLTSGPLALPLVASVAPQPPWSGAAAFVAHFHRIQTLPFYFGLLLVTGSILMLVAIFVLSKRQATSVAALVFMSIGGGFAALNYVIQTTFIPALVGTYRADLAPLITAFSMANPHSLTWAIEMWAYGFMGLGTWLAAGFFGATRVEKITKALFIANGVASVLGALAVSIDLGGVFSAAGLIGYGLWNVLYFALAITFYAALRARAVAARGAAHS